ncbi:hypothetical protein [Methanoregula sp.]
MAWKILATDQDVPVSDRRNILTPGLYGPALLQDIPLIEKQEMMV